MMFELFYNAALKATSPEELSTKLFSLSLDAIEPTPPFLTLAAKLAFQNKTKSVEVAYQLGANVDSIASGFAMAGNDAMVEQYRKEYSADKDYIGYGYAFVGNYAKVDEYLTEHNASINLILVGFALANNHEKVEEYLANYHPKVLVKDSDAKELDEKEKQQLAERQALYQTLINSIAEAYALTNNPDKVDEYLDKGANVDAIAKAYAFAGNHEKVEEYRVQHNADIYDIASGYKTKGTATPSFYRALNMLQGQGEAGKVIIDAIVRLKHGQDQFWNPYWMNSGAKLKLIIEAVESFPQSENMSDAIKDENSKLYKALNMHRLSPLTFLGRLGFYHTKSVQTANEELAKNESPQLT